MPASPASASAERSGQAVLLIGVNWLGDSIMAMPAIQAYRRDHPAERLVILVRPKLKTLWTMQSAVDEVWCLAPGVRALRETVRAARLAGFAVAFILPHSFRSALVPFLARIPRRIGPSGYWRDWLLTEVVLPRPGAAQEHQGLEYLNLFGSAGPPEAPSLQLPPELTERARALLTPALPGVHSDASERGWIAVLPGAAYGPAKRWPAERFAMAAQLLKERLSCNIVLLGLSGERALCEVVARRTAPGSLNLAGQTSLAELAAVMAQCKLALSNDSGGMHLAAAMGIPLVAIFGVTDPARTGPLGSKVRVLQDSAERSRDIRRDSSEASASLLRITPEQVAAAAMELLNS